MAVAFKSALGEIGSVTAGTTLVLTTLAAIDVGDFVIVRASADNLNATTPTFTCADSATGGSNVYTTHIQRATNATAAAGVAGAIMATVAVRPVPAGGTITVTLSGSVASKSMFARSMTGVLNTLRNAAVSAAGASTAPAVTSGAASIGDLVCGAVAAETRATPTADSDTTGGAWQAMEFTPSATGGTDTARTIVTGQYKIATAAGAQTYNNTTANTDWVALIAIFQPAPDPAISQAAYQWFSEGTETGATSLGAQNTAINGDINNGDATGTLRVRLQETGSGAVPASDDWQLQYEKNTSGTWVNITPSSAAVQTYDSPNLTGTGATTNRLTGGTGSFTAGEVSEDGTANDKGWAISGFTEFVYALKVIAADVAAGDTLRFRVLRNGATDTMTYSVTPTINIILSAVDRPGTISTNWGDWTATADGTVSTPANDWPGAIASDWGVWGATATGTVETPPPPDHPGTISSSWGTWTATANTLREGYAGITTTWGPWTATALAGVQHAGAIATSWGSWTATALAVVVHPATIATTWGAWSATATASIAVIRPATIASSWGAWTATSTGIATAAGRIESPWSSAATATTFADIIFPATIDTNWSGAAPWSPDDIAGLSLWLEADGLTPGALSAWPNPGSAVDAAMLGTPLPVVVAGVTPTGKSVVRFTAGEGRVRSSGTGAAAAGLNWTVIYVARVRDAVAGRVVGAVYSPANLLIGYWNGFENTAYVEGFLTPDARRVMTTDWKLYTGAGEGTPGDARAWLYEDGVYQSGGHPVTGGWQDTFAIGGYDPVGASETTNSDVAGVLFYDSRLPDVDRNTAEQYMRAKYLGVGSMPGGSGQGWTATAIGSLIIPIPATISTSWGGFVATAVGTITFTWPATIATSWGTWSATATGLDDRRATIATSWGTWTATSTAVKTVPAVVTTSWGTWTATSSALKTAPATISTTWTVTATAIASLNHPATVATSWGDWTATAVANAGIPATAATNWGSWAATAIALGDHKATVTSVWGSVTFTAISGVTKIATIASNWATWSATAVGQGQRSASISTTWAWTATATAMHTSMATIATNWGTWDGQALGSQLGVVSGVVNTNWGSWAATSSANTNHKATISETWSWTATATAAVGHFAAISTLWSPSSPPAIATPTHPAAISTSWGTWTATAVSLFLEHKAAISTTWAAMSATAVGLRTITSTVATSWGTWAATAIGVPSKSATVATNWGTWNATALAQAFQRPATISTTWATWSGTSTTTVTRKASVATTWTTWSGTAIALRSGTGTVTTTWGTWTATATAGLSHLASIVSTYSATFTASATVVHSATAVGPWGRWTATAFGVASEVGTTLNEADTVYLGDEQVDRIYCGPVVAWESPVLMDAHG